MLEFLKKKSNYTIVLVAIAFFGLGIFIGLNKMIIILRTQWLNLL